MRHLRKNDPGGPLAFALMLTAGLMGCSAARAAESDSGDPAWAQIEAWAEGGAAAAKSEKPAAESKTPGAAPAKAETPPVAPGKSVKHSDPAFLQPLAAKFMQRASADLVRMEKRREWDHAWECAYKMEQFPKALEYLSRMLAESNTKRWKDRESWISQQIWETGILAPQHAARSFLEQKFKDYKERALASIEERAADIDTEEHAASFRKNERARIKRREEYFQESASLFDELNKLEQAGDSDPKALWELCARLEDKRPYWPLKHLRALCRLREWHPGFAQVASGEVQHKLVRLLADQFSLYKEAVGEAEAMIEKLPKHYAVKNGDMLWLAADCRLRQARETGVSNKDAIDLLKEAKANLEDFQRQYKSHWANKKNKTTGRSSFMDKIEDVGKELRRRGSDISTRRE